VSDDNVIEFKIKPKKGLMPGADSPNQIWQCPCGCQVFYLRADYQIECADCDMISHFRYFDLRLE
jgi:hypothetical protein